MTSGVAKVSSKGQVTIPKRVRDKLDIREQDRLLFSVEGGRLLVIPVHQRPLSELYGALPATRSYPGHDEIREKLHKELGQRIDGGDE